jgi:UDP:flavonoid glycosyltransferase YjiC (YdhE family)
MATILFAYEFGAGLGHLNRLLAVAKRLPEHRLVFALPDIALGRPVLERAVGTGFELELGVTWPAPNDPNVRQVPTQTFADVLRLFGFHEVERLRQAVTRWTSLLERLRPDLILSDFAPSLRLASGGRIPNVVVANGYTAPPSGQLFMPMRPWEAIVPPRSRTHEGEMLAAVNTVRASSGDPAIDYVADLFHGDATFVCTLAEFDPYARGRNGGHVWPFNVPSISGPSDAEEKRVFAYFQANHPALPNVIAALGRLGRPAEIYVQGADPRAVAARCARNIGVHPRPADFASVLPRASLLVHHAGLGTAYAGLVAGVPQLVFPLNLEHAITSAGLEAFGATIRERAAPPPEPARLVSAMTRMIDEREHGEAATRAAAILASRRDPGSVEQVVGACRALLQ